jgi:hypothetical protein
MGMKAFAAKWLAKWEVKQIRKWSERPLEQQEKTFSYLKKVLADTAFGDDHRVTAGMTYEQWKQAVPVRDYEELRPWVDRVVHGESNVLWKGKPAYLCKTSGTTSGVKYIPMSKEGIAAQVKAARCALMCYMHGSGNTAFVDGKMMFLQGSPKLETKHGIEVGRLSGIVAHHVPQYLQTNRLPSWQVNRIEDWEKKVDAIVEETQSKDLRLISGIPPWVQMYFERMLQKTGKATVQEVFPNLSLFAHGGVNYAPYKNRLEQLIGSPIDTVETYPASEGFIAFQDDHRKEGLLLNLDAGIFYEFIPLDQIHQEKPIRIRLEDVEVGQQYAIVLNTSSGLWGYLIGDTVKFVSKSPYRIVVSGRIKHFISAFGEHVIAEEVENAMTRVCAMEGQSIQEFHVAPQVSPAEGLPYHEWFIESDEQLPEAFAQELDRIMRELNPYYNDLIDGKVLQPLKLRRVPRGAFNTYMKSQGKLGGQNKLPRLSNDRSIADKILATMA